VSYAAIADLQARFDTRLIEQLSSDDNSGVLSTSNAQACLDDAAGEILTSALQGSQYTAAQLTALATASPPDPQLLRMNCFGAIKFLYQRRGQGIPQNMGQQAREYLDFLEALRSGKSILNVPANRGADLPASVNLTGLERSNLGDLTSNEFFGYRGGTRTTTGPNE
jgi:phage gp36-like protein